MKGEVMKKYPLIGVSTIAVVLLVLGSLSNVVGYQTVQSSNQKVISNEVNQKELLFQTIVDIANNKEIQRIILKSQISRGQFPVSNTPVLTKNQLKQMYFIGLILSKFISKSRMHSIFEQYQLISPEMQQEIKDVIEKDATLNAEMMQLSNSKCDCENVNTTRWSFPVLCMVLWPLYFFTLAIWVVHNTLYSILLILKSIGLALNCSWSGGPP
jgi:hypothetical protein